MSVMKDKSTGDVSEITCDREGCTGRGEPTEQWIVVEYFNRKTSELKNRKDLCPDCAQELYSFVNGAPVEAAEEEAS